MSPIPDYRRILMTWNPNKPIMKLLCGILLAEVLIAKGVAAETTLSVDFSHTTGALDSNLWSSSGQDQGKGTRALDQDLQHVGSVPYGGGRWFRTHDQLNMVRATGLGTDKAVYDWTDLDHMQDTIRAAGLTPTFAVMGNPSSYFTSFLDRAQLYAWKRLVTDLALHLEQRYGQSEVRSWLFESWNEPDGNYEWKWHTPAELNNYFDACSEGLKAADPALRFGGPAIAEHPIGYGGLFRTFMDHCDNGTNFFTGEKGVRLDFISFHRKRKPKEMVDIEAPIINSILREHPRFSSLPILDNEADSEVGWNTPRDHRATPWYAAFIARSVNEHLVRIIDGASITGGRHIDYRLSNDDSCWGPWEFRAQLTRFGTDEQFAFIKKPSHTVRTALALLGNERCLVTGWKLEDGVGAIATKRGSNQVAVLVYNYSDQTDAVGTTRIRLNLRNIPFSKGKYAHYRIDSKHGDTFQQWLALGAPMAPTDEEIQMLRLHQELDVCEPIDDVSGSSLSRDFDLPLPGVSLVLISADPGSGAEPITGIYSQCYPSLSGKHEDVMIKWSSASRFVKTYEVLYAPAKTGPFLRVNAADQIETGFVYQRPIGERGYAKVRATDYWGRTVGESEIIAIP